MATVIPIALQNGTIVSQNINVPKTGAWTVSLIGIPTADYENSLNTFSMKIMSSLDKGDTWQDYVGWSWQGGHFIGRGGVVNPVPAVTFGLERHTGNDRLHVEILVSNPFTFGIDVTQA
jgi:hypothetical protein